MDLWGLFSIHIFTSNLFDVSNHWIHCDSVANRSISRSLLVIFINLMGIWIPAITSRTAKATAFLLVFKDFKKVLFSISVTYRDKQTTISIFMKSLVIGRLKIIVTTYRDIVLFHWYSFNKMLFQFIFHFLNNCFVSSNTVSYHLQ